MKKILLISFFIIIGIFQSQAQSVWKIYKSGNYIYVHDTINEQLIEGGASSIEFRKILHTDTAYRIFKDGVDQLNFSIDVSDMIDVNNIPFTVTTFESFKEINTSTSQDVFVQDQHSPVIIAYFSLLEEETLLTNTVAIGDYDMTVDVITGIQVGEYVSIFNVAANRFYLGIILSISVNTLTMDTQMDFAYPAGSFVSSGSRNMNVDGSVTPVIFGLRNTDTAIGSSFDITKLIFTCLTSTAVDLSKFGDIAGGITRGLALRKKDGEYRNIFNVKTNGDISNIMDFESQSATNPSHGQDGFIATITFAGQNEIGVTLRLAPGEDLQIIIQDNQTTLLSLFVIAEEHEVVD